MDEHKELFIWKKEHEQYFIRELLVTEPYMFKPKSTERQQAWRLLMENLNKLEKPKFHVTVRSVRDRFTKMVENTKNSRTRRPERRGFQFGNWRATQIRGLVPDLLQSSWTHFSHLYIQHFSHLYIQQIFAFIYSTDFRIYILNRMFVLNMNMFIVE